MQESLSILAEAVQRDLMVDQLRLVARQEKSIPNSVEYDMRRFMRMPGWQVDDIGMMEYTYVSQGSPQNALELKFCVSGKAYCDSDECEPGTTCSKTGLDNCSEEVETVDIYSFRFTSTYLHQFASTKAAVSEAERYLSFEHDQTISHIIPLCNKNRMILASLFNHKYSGALENIYLNSQIQFLLVYSMDCLFGEGDRDKVYQCKFLEDERGRNAISQAREILLQHIGDPITIKELARKVATNECYLKKGFKEMFGTTIFDFYQSQRMEHAKYLLYDKGLSVTDVSALLGYSSISHFSTAFKKHTGIKPCDLLVR
ncbi:helix-turn-helix domain-containing protein [Phnomibacter sp. MR]|uniref:helix-turn-helix domain-containing protein n=1 Tax=Phnomibacter sp. MR TaxID=3042318 RepID=UPI003A80E272